MEVRVAQGGESGSQGREEALKRRVAGMECFKWEVILPGAERVPPCMDY